MTIKELKEQRKQAVDAMADIMTKTQDEKRSMTSEEMEAFDAASADDTRLTSEIQRAEALEAAQKRIAQQEPQERPGRETRTAGDREPEPRSEITPETRALAFQGWARFQMTGEVSEKQQQAMDRCGLSPHKKEMEARLHSRQARSMDELRERRDMSTSATEGGETIPEGFVYELERNMLFFGGILGNITTFRTDSGNDLPWPTVDDTSNVAVPIDEAGSAADGTAPTTGSVIWKAHKYTTKVVKLSQELLEDSAFNLAVYMSEAFGERIGRAINQDGTAGDEANRVSGILKEASRGTYFASDSEIDFDELIDLEHSVDPAYRRNASFMAHDSTIALMRKVKDKDDQYIWQRSLQAGAPGLLLGYPLVLNNDVPTMAAEAKVVAFGDLTRYRLRMVRAIRMYRLGELYRENDQDGFVAFVRMDGHILNAGTDPIKYAEVSDES